MLGGVIVLAVAIVVVAIVVSSGGGGNSNGNASGAANTKVVSASAACAAAKATAACDRVNTLLAGIPQSGNTLGDPKAPITVTEFGDLECSVCDEFALPPSVNISSSPNPPGTGYEDQLITQFVKTGKVKLVFRSLETATNSGATPGIWTQQQAAAYAAGMQNKAWDYIELFYNEQQPEGTPYTATFLEGIAKQVPGLRYSTWLSNRQDSNLESQVTSDGRFAVAHGYNATPTITIQGPKGQAQPFVGLPTSFAQLAARINEVS